MNGSAGDGFILFVVHFRLYFSYRKRRNVFFFFFWSYELSYNAKYYSLITVPCLFIIYDEEQVEWLTHGLSVERDDSNSILNARVDNT